MPGCNVDSVCWLFPAFGGARHYTACKTRVVIGPVRRLARSGLSLFFFLPCLTSYVSGTIAPVFGVKLGVSRNFSGVDVPFLNLTVVALCSQPVHLMFPPVLIISLPALSSAPRAAAVLSVFCLLFLFRPAHEGRSAVAGSAQESLQHPVGQLRCAVGQDKWDGTLLNRKILLCEDLKGFVATKSLWNNRTTYFHCCVCNELLNGLVGGLSNV